MRLIYLFGVPGSGKTSVFEALTREWTGELIEKPFAHIVYSNGVIQLGKNRKPFGGTDTLSMAVQPMAVSFLKSQRPKIVLAEGDRLANGKFFEAAREIGYQLCLWYLDTPMSLAEARREQRGASQNEIWLKGRERKVLNLLRKWEDRERVLEGWKAPEVLANQIKEKDLADTPRN